MPKYALSEATCPRLLIGPRLSGIHSVCMDILYSRGFHTSKEIEDFLFPSLSSRLRKMIPLLDTGKAVSILVSAVKNKQAIVIYHDYDADGITAAAVVKEQLTKLGVPVYLYCNNRAIDGFGMCVAGVQALITQFPDAKIVLTVDNGITAVEAVKFAKEQGLTVIITDHHEPGSELPAADAVIDNHRKDEPEAQDHNCCGAGVAWKLMLALYLELGYDPTPVMNSLDLVALGTVADVVPLLGDNRAMVQEGLRRINAQERPFFRKVAELLELQSIDSQTIGYKIAPMLNALSRMGYSPTPAVDTLLCTDEQKLHGDIVDMDDINQARREETDRELELVMASLPEENNLPVILFAHESLKDGIVGIVAGQIAQQYQVPCGIFARSEDGNWKGSLRAPSGFMLKESLDQCAKHLKSYGGHAKAAGATVFADEFDAFKAEFETLAQKARDEHGFEAVTHIDKVLPASQITVELVQELKILEPHGEGNPTPLFGLVANITDTRYMGTEQQHVKYQDASGLAVIRWGKGEEARQRSVPPKKFVGHPQLNSYKGNLQVQFVAD